jgi:hypothetical protein
MACLLCAGALALAHFPAATLAQLAPSGDAREVAAAVLKAYATADTKALQALGNETNRRIFGELAAQGEAHPRYRSIFLGWRMQAVRKWDGKLGEPAGDERRVQVPFGDAGPDNYYVVTLEREDGRWAFEDVNRARK